MISISRAQLALAATAVLVVGGVLASSGASQASVAPAAATHAGMTWVLDSQQSNGEVLVGDDTTTNAYAGDTPATAVIPMLCLVANNAPAPTDVSLSYYTGWAKGWIHVTPAISGTTLTSQAAANAICAADFGTGAVEAEFHDGYYGTGLSSSGGWGFWAYGTIPAATRFWVAIDDQPANPWD